MNKLFLAGKLIFDIVINFFTKKEIILISEGADWVIDEECKNIKEFLRTNTSIRARISITPTGARNKLIHFLSVNTFIGKNGFRNKEFIHNVHSSNKTILTWFHINNDDTAKIKFIPELNKAIDLVHTASNITKHKLIANGFPINKIELIPLGVDLNIFSPISAKEKTKLKESLELPKDKIIIGSFQKDGWGWGEGLKPKMEKGPDIFCDAVEKISKKLPVHILLTGPARGYVKRRLEDAKITYTHKYFSKYKDVVPFYQALDAYPMCSREEGGPKALLETMATGVPIIATHVGMVPDVIENGTDGIIVSLENTDLIAEEVLKILNDKNLNDRLVKNALIKVKKFDLNIIGKQFYQIYNNLMANK